MKDLLEYRNELLCGEKITLRGTTAEDEAILAKWWNEETMLLGNRSRIVPTRIPIVAIISGIDRLKAVI